MRVAKELMAFLIEWPTYKMKRKNFSMILKKRKPKYGGYMLRTR